jgi:CheY-like chemotaxis protein
MGGRLQVESTLGAGSRFWFSLPLVEGREGLRGGRPDLEAGVPALDARLAPGERVTALVVDDSTANRRILAGLLESAGVEVITAAGGLEAIELARTHRPDIVFMDLRMDDLDGLEATRRLGRDPDTAAIPVVAVTASAFGNVRPSARAAGCVDYLSKPVRAPLLFGMLQTHLGVRLVSAGEQAAARDARLSGIEHRVELVSRLRSAVALGDVSEIQAIVQDLMRGSPAEAAMGERIGRLAMNFDFEGLNELADSLAT